MLVYLFLPMIMFLGIVTSYEDKTYGKIRNKWIAISVVYCISANFLVFWLGYAGLKYLAGLALNGIISLALGFVMWRFHLLSAGDVKLFFAYSILLPLDAYKFVMFGYFPAANLLMLAFMPLAFVYFFASISSLLKKRQLLPILKSVKVSEMAAALLFLFSVGWILRLLLGHLGIPSLLNVFLTVLLLLAAGRVSKPWLNIVLPMIALLRLFFDPAVFSAETWTNLFILFSVFFAVRLVLANTSFSLFTKPIKLSELKEGMVPAELILKIDDKYKKIRHTYLTKMLPKNSQILLRSRPEGLFRSDISRISRLAKKMPFDNILVNQTISFAPVMFFGVLIQILAVFI